MAFGKVAVLVALLCVLAQGQNLTQSALPELKQRAPFGVGNFFFGLEPPLQVSVILKSDPTWVRPSGTIPVLDLRLTQPNPALRCEPSLRCPHGRLHCTVGRSVKRSQTHDLASLECQVYLSALHLRHFTTRANRDI